MIKILNSFVFGKIYTCVCVRPPTLRPKRAKTHVTNIKMMECVDGNNTIATAAAETAATASLNGCQKENSDVCLPSSLHEHTVYSLQFTLLNFAHCICSCGTCLPSHWNPRWAFSTKREKKQQQQQQMPQNGKVENQLPGRGADERNKLSCCFFSVWKFMQNIEANAVAVHGMPAIWSMIKCSLNAWTHVCRLTNFIDA